MSAAHNSRPARMSFAQVAAAANRPVPKRETPNGRNNDDDQIKSKSTKPHGQSLPVQTAKVTPIDAEVEVVVTDDGQPRVDKLADSLQGVALEETQPPFPPIHLLRKDNSDTKSIASRTTLTLDEKESLRPDDSASMQAAPEDDILSNAGSALAASRPGSDESNAFRAQLGQIQVSDTGRVIMPRAQRPDSIDHAPRSEALLFHAPQLPVEYAPIQQSAIELARPQQPSLWISAPDEKLLEALASPKDRLFVIKVEQDLIDFIKDPKEEYLQLPGTNSFYRMLSHKLADYYMLGHVLDDSMSSVRIFRTPQSRLPPPLIGSNPATTNSTPPPSSQTRKIMRRGFSKRGGGTDETLHSVDSSMTTSENGDGLEDGKDKLDKGQLTREERENRYKEARARIFKGFEEQESNDSGSNEKGVSRASSTSGVKKAPKQRKARDDGFEARSAYDPYGRRLDSFGDGSMMQPGEYMDRYGMPHGNFPLPKPAFGQHWPESPYPMSYSPYGQEHVSVGAYPTSPYGSPIANDATPKGTAPSLFGQGYASHPPMPWSPNDYGDYQQMYPYQNTGGYDASSRQDIHSPGFFGFNPAAQTSSGYSQGYLAGGYDQGQHFDPQSQSFVPMHNGTFAQGNGAYQAGGFRQASNASQPVAHQPSFSRTTSATHQNGHGFVPTNSRSPGFQMPMQSYPLHPASPPQQRQQQSQQANALHRQPFLPGPSPHSGQHSTIAKWPAPADLPQKPPRPSATTGLTGPSVPSNAAPGTSPGYIKGPAPGSQPPSAHKPSAQPLPPKPISTR